MDTIHIEELIERYFNGETSTDEERKLRHMLSDSSADTETVREARAVMGYFSVKRKKNSRSVHSSKFGPWRRTITSAAAVALLLLSITVTLNFFNRGSVDCEMYIAGVLNTDTETALNLMEQQLRLVADTFSDIDNGISADIDMIADVFSNREVDGEN